MSNLGNINLGSTSKARRYDGVNASLPDAFHNDYDAQITIQHETARHREIVYAYMSCHVIKEVAARFDLTSQYVSNILRQPWARQLMQSEVKKVGQADLKDLISGIGRESLMRLESLAKEAQSEQVKASTNQYLVDRFLGKPSQPIVTSEVEPSKLSPEELEKRAATILERHSDSN